MPVTGFGWCLIASCCQREVSFVRGIPPCGFQHRCPSSVSRSQSTLNMVDFFKFVQHVAAVQNYFPIKTLLVIKNMLVLNENNNHINVLEELVEIGVLVLGDLVVLKERVITLERPCKVALLSLKHL